MMENQASKRSKGRGLKWALGLSLALNLVVVGAFTGAAIRGGDKPKDRGPSAQNFGAPFVRALPREAKHQLREALQSAAAELPSREERRMLYAELLEALRADTFDAEAARAVFASQGKAAQSVQEHAQGEWIALVSNMDATKRAEVADRLQETLQRKRRKGEPRP